MNHCADSFSFRRFLQLLRLHVAEHARTYLLVASEMMLSGLFFLGVTTSKQDFSALYCLLLFVSAIVLLAQIATPYVDSRKATMAYTLPASQTEKFLVLFFASTVGFALHFGVVTLLLAGLSRLFAPLLTIAPADCFCSLGEDGTSCYVIGVLHALLLLGAAWARRSVVRTWLAMLAVIFFSCYALCKAVIAVAFFCGCRIYDLFDRILLINTTISVQVDLFSDVEDLCLLLVMLTGWVAAWLKFKERTLK